MSAPFPLVVAVDGVAVNGMAPRHRRQQYTAELELGQRRVYGSCIDGNAETCATPA